MMAKNLPKRQSFWKIPLRILMDFISAFKSLFSGQFVYFLAIGEAHLAFFKWLFFKRKSSVFSYRAQGPALGMVPAFSSLAAFRGGQGKI